MIDTAISAWVLLFGASFVAVPFVGPACTGAVGELLAGGRSVYTVAAVIALAAAAMGVVRHWSGPRGQ